MILALALPLALAFAAIWFFPKGLGSLSLLGYLLASSLVFYSLHAVYSVALLALGIESTPDYHERTRLYVFGQLCSFVCLVGIQWAFPLIRASSPTDPIAGARRFALLIGPLLAAGAVLPFFFNREAAAGEGAKSVREPFRVSLRAALANRTFLRVAVTRAVYSFSYNLVSILGLYLNYYYIFRGDIGRAAIQQSWNGTIFQISGIGALFLVRWLALRYGKRNTVLLTAVVFAFGCLCKLIVYVPGRPWLQVIVYIANGFSAAGIITPTDAMLPDIADHDRESSGLRREGMFASILAWFDRIGNSIGTLISGFILVWMGFDVKLAAQSAATPSPHAIRVRLCADAGRSRGLLWS